LCRVAIHSVEIVLKNRILPVIFVEELLESVLSYFLHRFIQLGLESH
jgi:hypothetical protein